jgi:DNA polymerase III subunit delta
MRLRSNQLHAHLKQGLQRVYWVSGDDVLLNSEAVDAIRQTARTQGFSEREVIDSEGGIDWSSLYAANQSMSLFGDRKIIEVRLDKKPDTYGQAALVDYCASVSADNLLIISSARVDAATFKTKWFNKVDKVAVSLQIWPLNRGELPAWLQQRASILGLTIDQDATSLLVERVEGNLLAAKQELDKLALSCDDKHISLQTIAKSVADSARYSVFDLSDPLMIGDFARLSRICHVLRAEGIEIPIILWSIARELRQLYSFQQLASQGMATNQIMMKLRLPPMRQQALQRGSQRLQLFEIESCLLKCGELDLAVKGASAFSKELKLQELLSACCKMAIADQFNQLG